MKMKMKLRKHLVSTNLHRKTMSPISSTHWIWNENEIGLSKQIFDIASSSNYWEYLLSFTNLHINLYITWLKMSTRKSSKTGESISIIIKWSAAKSWFLKTPEFTEPDSIIKSSSTRKPYGQRLNQKNEILLFELCVQHSLNF